MHALGLDIGGSKTHAVSSIRGPGPTEERAEAYATSANISSVGEREATIQLRAILAGLAAQGHDTPPDIVCAGAAGVDSPAAEERLRTLLSELLPRAEVHVVHDTHLVLAAAGVSEGIAVISGTGSVGWGRTADGRTARAGGWGFLLGDDGSGYGIARAAVRHVLARADDRLPADHLTATMLSTCGVRSAGELIGAFYSRSERRYWARKAETVFALADAGDEPSVRIVHDAGLSLAHLIGQVRHALDPDHRLPVVLGGGVLVNQPALGEVLRHHLRDSSTLLTIDRDPAHGALDLALTTLTEGVPA